VLPIVIAEQAIEDCGIAIDEHPLIPARTSALLASVEFDVVMP
jgi:hypothetical protein